jgi:AraC-like DNA-binding protein
MDDFTYAGLVALLERTIAARDPDLVEGRSIADPMKGATASAADKEALVAKIMTRHGPGPLLVAGQSLHLADESPALTVLQRSATPRVLAEKFMRLERYHHSSHRTAIVTRRGRCDCTRSSKAHPPTLGENCLIAGLLLGLLMHLGREGARLEIGGQVFAPEDLPDAALDTGTDGATFGIFWTPSESDQDPPRQEATETGTLADNLAALFETDLGRSWKLADAAKLLALSQRSLQRGLTAEARSYSSVLRRARMKQATLLLTETETSLAEIGYCCSYADQAHFQRDFLRTANATPREVRRINRESDVLAR